ncbi:OmpA family protein [Myxococcus stipitatus DSM 14675]|uniref:OmpA family protein n=1 Tax=Myxococcus stipitatus (strain DSM 14675 / JCM 12634 / Mx s8) TaxID=1278073 RepID=L7UB61_MYXSD|nr:OmpA family protein [Myxococcus stipitatus]AGC43699.1 OmpA family protein [Myxococcus stipitatus DSM 14675]
MRGTSSGHLPRWRPLSGSIIRLVVLGLMMASAAASAEPDPFSRGFDAVPVKPTPAQNSGIALEGTSSGEPVGSFRGALLFDFNWRILALKLGDEKLGDLLPYRLDAHLLFAYQLHERVELGVDLPITVLQGDNFHLLRDALNAPNFPGAAGVSRTTLGDMRVVPRLHLLDREQFPVGVSLVPEVRLPTGSADSFTGERGVLFAPRLAVEHRFGSLAVPIRVIGNVGMRLRKDAQYLNLRVGDELTLGGGAIAELPNMGRFTDVQATAEMHLGTPLVRPFNFDQADSLKTPWEALVGARAKIWGNWGLELNVGRGINLSSGYGREALRVMFGLRYDESFADSDGDNVPDHRDRCPNEAEDKDGFMDGDGCPDPDNDDDGVVDGEDSCPDVKGPKERKGCPEVDTDGDGITDEFDKCPEKPGPKDYDGCPDTDGDEVPDNEDDCPDQFGPPENNGCPFDSPPYVFVESDRIRIKGNVLFETGSAVIQKRSYPLLDEVATVLRKNPTLGPVLIEGHTDNRGSRQLNMGLSDRRARSVLDYLVSKSIERKRLSSAGFGFDRPIATNDTALGRAKNRRVDFKLVRSEVETEGKETVVPAGQQPPATKPSTGTTPPAAPSPAPAPKPSTAQSPAPAAKPPSTGTPALSPDSAATPKPPTNTTAPAASSSAADSKPSTSTAAPASGTPPASKSAPSSGTAPASKPATTSSAPAPSSGAATASKPAPASSAAPAPASKPATTRTPPAPKQAPASSSGAAPTPKPPASDGKAAPGAPGK